MNIFTELREVLSSATLDEGKILSSSGTTFTVSTKRGSMQVERQVGDITNYRLGDTVRLKNSFLIGKTPSTKNSIKYPLN